MPPWAAGVLVVLLAVLAYANSLDGAWQYDDLHTIRDNAGIRGLGSYIDHFAAHINRPVLFLTFALNFTVGGVDPFGYHVVNLILHALNALLVGALAGRIVLDGAGSSDRHDRDRIFFLAGALFAVHPAATEAVSYVSSRSSVLASSFYLGSVLVFLRAREATGRARALAWLISVIFFGLSMATKEIAMSLPLVLIVLEHGLPWPGARPASWRRTARWVGPMFGLLAAAVLVRLALVGFRNPTGVPWSYGTHLATQSHAWLIYLRLALLPVGLTIDHAVDLSTGFGLRELGGLLVLIALVGSAVAMRRRAPVYSVCVAWALLTLAPTSLIPLLDLVAERRLYLPLVGVTSCGAWALVALGRSSPQRGKFALGLALAIVALLAVGTIARNQVWQTPVALWRDAVLKAPFKARPHGSFGTALAQSGRLDAAIEEYGIAIELDPNFWDYRIDRAILERVAGSYSVAIAEFEALLAEPDAERVHVAAAHELAEVYRLRGEARDDRADLDEALRLHRRNAESGLLHRSTFLRIGRILLLTDRDDEARAAFEAQVLRWRDDAQGYRTLGIFLYRAGQPDEAMQWLERALEVDPSDRRSRAWLDDLRAGRPVRVE